MPLDIYQKSLYVGLFNSTMIGRSVGKTLKNGSFKDFKLSVLKESEKLIFKMEEGNLFEKDIIDSLDELVKRFEISYGQAQKGINVILKYHYQLYKNLKRYNGEVLHCPIDSIILAEPELKELNIGNLPLSKIDKIEYLSIQNKIQKEMAKLSKIRVDFDERYDEKFLAENWPTKN